MLNLSGMIGNNLVLSNIAAPSSAPDTPRRGEGEGPMRTNNYVQLRAPRVAPLHSADNRFVGRKRYARGGRGWEPINLRLR